jgi:hypothetical protein
VEHHCDWPAGDNTNQIQDKHLIKIASVDSTNENCSGTGIAHEVQSPLMSHAGPLRKMNIFIGGYFYGRCLF